MSDECKCCGYCEHCGRSGPQQGYHYYAYWSVQPPYYTIGYPITTWGTGGISGTTSGSSGWNPTN